MTKKTKPPFAVLLFAIALLLGGCLDISETLQMNSDGSGTLTLSIDVSKIRDNPKLYADKDDMYEEPDPTEYDDSAEYREELERTKAEWADNVNEDLYDMTDEVGKELKGRFGQNIKSVVLAKEKGTMTIIFAFKHVGELDALYHSLDSMATGKMSKSPGRIFSLNGNMLNRSANFFYLNRPYYNDSTLIRDIKEEVGDNSRAIADLQYSLTCIFARPIALCTNKGYVISADKKSCTLKANFFDLAENKRTLATEITLGR